MLSVLFYREGQPLKLPETKKTLLFTFTGEHFVSGYIETCDMEWCFIFPYLFLSVVPGMGNTSPKDMDALLPLMNMVIYSIDKVKKLRLNREVSTVVPHWFAVIQAFKPKLYCRYFSLYLGQTESWQKPGPCGRELPEADSCSASGGGADTARGEEESREGENHEWGGPWETTSFRGLKRGILNLRKKFFSQFLTVVQR